MSSLKKLGPLNGVIFDFDETIANTLSAREKGLAVVCTQIHNYLEKNGEKVDAKELFKRLSAYACKMVGKGVDDRNIWWEFTIKNTPKGKINPERHFLNTLTKNYWATVVKNSTLYKETLPVFSYLKKKGYKLGLLTDSDKLKGFKKKRISALFNPRKWFNLVVIAGEDTKNIKPDKEPFFLILKKLQLKPRQCAFVGDDPYRDILGAKKMGMAAILIKRRNSKIKTKPDHTIHSLIELKKIF